MQPRTFLLTDLSCRCKDVAFFRMVYFGSFPYELDSRRFLEDLSSRISELEGDQPQLTDIQGQFVRTFTSLCLDSLGSRLRQLCPLDRRNRAPQRLPNQTRLFELFCSDIDFLANGVLYLFRRQRQQEVPRFVYSVIFSWFMPALTIMRI